MNILKDQYYHECLWIVLGDGRIGKMRDLKPFLQSFLRKPQHWELLAQVIFAEEPNPERVHECTNMHIA